MNVSVSTAELGSVKADLLMLPISADSVETRLASYADVFGEVVQRAAPDFQGTFEQTVLLYPIRGKATRVLLVGLGPADALTPERLRRVAAKGATTIQSVTAKRVAVVMPEDLTDAEATAEALTEGFMLGVYQFAGYKSEGDEQRKEPQEWILWTSKGARKDAKAGSRTGRILAEATRSARDLVNQSPGELTATALARAAKQAAETYGYKATVWNKSRIAKEGMGGLLAVNRGSLEPPTFTILEWKPAQAVNKRPIVLVGKGVVFDTGGLSLKSTKGSMDKMKYDMAGAAAVLGAMEGIARLELPVHVITLVPSTDNRPGQNAYVPGEVVRMHSGLSVEVLNTDAEGRMLLADALSYARRYDPELVVDLATLTGAQVVALGSLAAAILTNEGPASAERLARFQAAGDRTGDRVAPLPMFEEYAEALKSDVADLKNVGGREAGTITAAKFLERFTAYPWVHLDIAGPAFQEERTGYRPKGGTGYGVRLLIEVLRAYVADAQA